MKEESQRRRRRTLTKKQREVLDFFIANTHQAMPPCHVLTSLGLPKNRGSWLSKTIGKLVREGYLKQESGIKGRRGVHYRAVAKPTFDFRGVASDKQWGRDQDAAFIMSCPEDEICGFNNVTVYHMHEPTKKRGLGNEWGYDLSSEAQIMMQISGCVDEIQKLVNKLAGNEKKRIVVVARPLLE